MIIFRLVVFLILFLVHLIERVYGVGYCYSPLGGIPHEFGLLDAVSIQCPPGSTFDLSAQLCCSQTQIQNADPVQTYQQFPIPAGQGIPQECRRAIHLKSTGVNQCPDTKPLCEPGQSANNNVQYHLCCDFGPQQCDQLRQRLTSIIHLAPMYTGTSRDQRGALCLDMRDTMASVGSHQCGPNAIWDELAQCCIRASAAQPSRTGRQSAGGTTNCQDRAQPGRASDCPANQNLCNNPLYFDLMTAQCPFTCKRCGQTPANAQFLLANVLSLGACVDRVGPDGKSDCPSRVAFCNVTVWRAFMRLECPFTCNVCTGATSSRLSAPTFTTSSTTSRPRIPPGILGRK